MGANLPPYVAPPKRRIVSSRSGAMGGLNATNVTDGTSSSATYRNWHQAPSYAISDLIVAFANWRLSATGETVGANSITVKAAIEYNGSSWPLYFKGQRTAVIDAGGTLYSDPLGVQIPSGASFWTRVYVTNNSNASGTWPNGRQATSNGFESNNYVAATGADAADGTGQITGNNLSGQGAYMFGPVSITGIPAINAPAIGILGDSIVAGTGDGFYATRDYQGYIERGLGATLSWNTVTRGSYRGTFIVANPSRALALHSGFVTAGIVQIGVNDVFAANLTLAQMQASQLTLWGYYANRGARCLQTTISPYTTSTDLWATTGNQTKISGTQDAIRVNFNNWLRAGAPISAGVAVAVGTGGALLAGQGGHPLTGYIEIADLCESARDSGLWAVNGTANYATADGLHYSTATHTAAAAVISAAVNFGAIS